MLLAVRGPAFPAGALLGLFLVDLFDVAEVSAAPAGWFRDRWGWEALVTVLGVGVVAAEAAVLALARGPDGDGEG